MDGGSDSPVLIVQRSPHTLLFGQPQPLPDLSLPADLPSDHPPHAAPNEEGASISAMSQPQALQAIQSTPLSEPAETPMADPQTTSMASNTVEPVTTAAEDTLSMPSTPPTNAETTSSHELIPEMPVGAAQEALPTTIVEADAIPAPSAEDTAIPQDPSLAIMEPTTEPASEASPPVVIDPVTPPGGTEPPPPPPANELPDWINIEEDTSAPDEEELKAYEGRMQSTSALDVKHHEETFYPDIDDPEQRPVKKIRLTWVIKGVRGTKQKPSTVRVINSAAAFVDGFYWSIRFFPRGNNASTLSAYIKCTKKQPKPDSNPPESTFSFVQGGPDTDLSELKPEAELTTPPPVEQDGGAAPRPEDSKPDEEVNKSSVEAENSGPAITSEGADKSEGEGGDDDDDDDDEEDWRVSAQIGMIIYNPQEPRTKYDMSSEHQFNKHNDDWGWTNFHGPWTDIPRRRPGQYQALLRNDTIAMDAYIRVFEDPTQALWWHESQESEKYWDSKSLAGYFPMGTPPLYHSPGVAGITAWLLLAPFRQIVQRVDTSGWRRDSTIQPRPLLCQIQLVLYMMRKMKKDENYVNVNKILDLMDMLGESHSDVISFWEAFRRSIELELELKDQDAVKQISDIFDGRTADGQVRRHTDPIVIDVEKASSVQDGLEDKLGSLAEKQEFPKFFSVALGRDKFDTKVREWKLLYNRVELDEEIDVSQWANDQTRAKYTLYGFMVHVGERSSGKFYSVLRPNGPGTKWLAFEDGDGNKVFSYTKHRIQEFEGLEGDELKTNKSTRQTAYLVMYIRTDVLTEFLPGALEPYQMASWLRQYLVAPCHTEDEPTDDAKDSYDCETTIEIYSSAIARGIKGSLDMYTLKDVQTASTPPLLKLTVPPKTTYTQLRQKIAKWRDVDNVEKIRLWKMKLGPLGEHVTASMEKVQLHRPINGSGDSVRPLCLWMHLLDSEDDVKLYGDPDPSLDDDPFTRPVFEDEAVVIAETTLGEPTAPPTTTEPRTNPEHAHDTVDAGQSTQDTSMATDMSDGGAVATLPPADSIETPSLGVGNAAAPDAEQDAVAEAVRATAGRPADDGLMVEVRSAAIAEDTELTEAAPDAEQDGIGEAVRSAVAENPSVAESRPSAHHETTQGISEVETPTIRAEVTESSSRGTDPPRADGHMSLPLDTIQSVGQSTAVTTEESTVPAASVVSPVTTRQTLETTAEVVPSSEAIAAPIEMVAAEAEATITEAVVPEVTVPEATITEATVTEATVPQATVTEAVVPEVTVPEATITEATVTEATVPQATVTEAAVPEVTAPEATVPEATVTEAAVPEAAVPEAAVPEATVPGEDGPAAEAPTSTGDEDPATSDAMIAALIAADFQATNGDPWDTTLAPPPPQPTILGDIIDTRSEDSSANEEPPRPFPHVYGFIQLFDAVKQEFSVHGTFLAKESATIRETVREALGYPEDKEFSVWTRHKSYRTAAVSTNSIFESLEFRSDGFVLIIGDMHSESTKNALLMEGKFTNPEQLSRYLWMAARRHPTHAFTGKKTINVFGTDFYAGPIFKGLSHGPSATHISSNGQTYHGPYVAGERSGDDGKMIYQNGDVYEGSWLKNEKHGQGSFVEKRTGNKYVGGFQSGKRWGKGTTYWEEADEQGDMCQICYGEEIDALFYDCGHVCACVDCAKQVDSCPICRKNVRQVVKMYRS